MYRERVSSDKVWRKASKNKLKDANFSFPMFPMASHIFTQIRTHAQEDLNLLELKSNSIPKILALKIAMHSV